MINLSRWAKGDHQILFKASGQIFEQAGSKPIGSIVANDSMKGFCIDAPISLDDGKLYADQTHKLYAESTQILIPIQSIIDANFLHWRCAINHQIEFLSDPSLRSWQL